MEEKVIISLDRYNAFLVYKKRSDYLDDFYNEIREIVDEDDFDINKTVDKRIYDLYKKMINKRWC